MPPLPEARSHLGAIALNNHLYAVGGQTSLQIVKSSVQRFNSKTFTWTLCKPMKVPRRNFGIATLNDHIFVVGGQQTAKHNSTSVEKYDPVTDTWMPVR